ncbi:MAG: carbon storage regulator [Planctomycetaceae bacterium]|nr:carbon storage regulator [Planctomycetaceae bacterium]
MLVLQRKVGEQIRIGTDIVVTVLRSACGKVSFGIQAPPHCVIRREELMDMLTSAVSGPGVPSI